MNFNLFSYCIKYFKDMFYINIYKNGYVLKVLIRFLKVV